MNFPARDLNIARIDRLLVAACIRQGVCPCLFHNARVKLRYADDSLLEHILKNTDFDLLVTGREVHYGA